MARLNSNFLWNIRRSKIDRRRSIQLERASFSAIEALERRVLMSSISIVVQTTGDGSNSSTHSGSSGSYTTQTLREAVNFSDTKSNPSTITFLSSLSGGTVTLTPAFGSLQLENTGFLTTIIGLTSSGANVLSVNGNNATAIFNIRTGVSATIKNLNIIGGKASSGNGGGILNFGGTLTLTQCTISGDSATDGGGIYNSGSAYVGQCTVTGGTASNKGGGITNVSGGTLTLTSTTISNDSVTGGAGGGGGIYNAGSASVTSCTISGDSASNAGGGIANGSTGTLTLASTNVSSGTLTGGVGGGGVYNAGRANITLCAVTGNTATVSGCKGGGIDNEFGVLTAGNDTITGNNSSDGGGHLLPRRRVHRIGIFLHGSESGVKSVRNLLADRRGRGYKMYTSATRWVVPVCSRSLAA